MSSEESAKPSHVSASKKASRKLKHAKDTPAVEDSEAKEVDKKDKKAKDKKKKSKSSDGQSNEDVAVTTDVGEKKQKQKEKKSKKRRLDEENDGEENSVAEPESESQQRCKKKRVSFSADTVMRDAEESENESRPEFNDDLQINGDAEEGQAPLATEEQVDADDEGEKKKKKKEKKKKKKDQSTTTASDTTPTSHESPILSYLNLYHQNRSAWKFQKNRETHLFKHILSSEHVPAKYNAALLSYLKGLKSEGAKQRLGQVAEEVVKAEMEEDLAKEQEAETEDKAESNTAGYHKAVEAFRTRLSQGKDDFDEIETPDSLDGERLAKLQRRQRAELVLFAVSGKLFYLEKTKAKRGPSTQAPPVKKKKKNRTAFVEISSSSESESSSDSDSDSEKKPKKAAKPKKDISSESSSTDSSSDSDDNGSHKKKTTRKKQASSIETSSDTSADSSSDSDSD
jgi:20S proteasome subunit alpha 1